ncbi:MAG: filamentous hemagglutinin N-terminal domain-containing protein [Pseudomonadota bacterium]
MNRNRYRLKFNDLTGCWVPVAEHMRARGKRGRCATLRVLAGAVAAAFSLGVSANGPLPVAAGTFIAPNSPGMAAAPVVNGSTMTITQTTAAPVVMQWNSFSVDQGHAVRFVQPDVTSRAINVVLPGGPRSDIYGSIQANGQVFLFNQAGVLFGPNAVVDVGGLVASSLRLNDELINRSLSALGVTGAALSGDASAGDVMVQAGARIIAADNGRIVLAAPRVSNAGTLQANQGQVLLAAGEKVYLADSLDSRLRGLLIEVDNGGTVSNEVAGKLVAERGNITLAGLNVNQLGSARTTTSVTLNGSIHLNARDTMVARTVTTATGRRAGARFFAYG